MDELTLSENIESVLQRIETARLAAGSKDVLLVPAVKTQSLETLWQLKRTGLITDIGENRVQELLEKQEVSFRRHFIGRLQSNKVKYIIDKVCLIHSLDRMSLAEEINRQSLKRKIKTNVLLEVNIAAEESKGGVLPDDAFRLLEGVKKLDAINVVGLMSVLPKCENRNELEKYCLQMRNLYDKMKDNQFRYLSMGMSNDFECCIAYGANLVRIGRQIFGERR